MSDSDRQIIREVAKRVAEIAALPVQEERKRRWKLHNSLKSVEPMLLVFQRLIARGGWLLLNPKPSFYPAQVKGSAVFAG